MASLASTRDTVASTVFSLTNSAAATSRLLIPSATSCATFSSVTVSPRDRGAPADAGQVVAGALEPTRGAETGEDLLRFLEALTRDALLLGMPGHGPADQQGASTLEGR